MQSKGKAVPVLLYVCAIAYLLGSGWAVKAFVVPALANMPYWIHYLAWAAIFVPFVWILSIAYASQRSRAPKKGL